MRRMAISSSSAKLLVVFLTGKTEYQCAEVVITIVEKSNFQWVFNLQKSLRNLLAGGGVMDMVGSVR